MVCMWAMLSLIASVSFSSTVYVIISNFSFKTFIRSLTLYTFFLTGSNSITRPLMPYLVLNFCFFDSLIFFITAVTNLVELHCNIIHIPHSSVFSSIQFNGWLKIFMYTWYDNIDLWIIAIINIRTFPYTKRNPNNP